MLRVAEGLADARRAAEAEEDAAAGRQLCALRVRHAEKAILAGWADWAAGQLDELPPAERDEL